MPASVASLLCVSCLVFTRLHQTPSYATEDEKRSLSLHACMYVCTYWYLFLSRSFHVYIVAVTNRQLQLGVNDNLWSRFFCSMSIPLCCSPLLCNLYASQHSYIAAVWRKARNVSAYKCPTCFGIEQWFFLPLWIRNTVLLDPYIQDVWYSEAGLWKVTR